MIKELFPIEKFAKIETPFYFYDVALLKETLKVVQDEIGKENAVQHYAVKANANPRILELIASKGFGADCVSGNEIKAAMSAGFPASKIVFAGVSKTDKEIKFALDSNIFCFNVESLAELKVINEIASVKGKVPQVALRINPNVDAHTHAYITTGLSENKFGLDIKQLDGIVDEIKALKNVSLVGVHFHIGSQIEEVETYKPLCDRINELQTYFKEKGIVIQHVNVGGGLGIDYDNPELNRIPRLKEYFQLFRDNLNLDNGQVLHFELGRAIVAQCGSLISRVTYIKEGVSKKFAILDAGMTELIRPALYKAYHKIENLTSNLPKQKYDVVGPICESSDCFVKDYDMNETSRGDLIAILSAGAYGEVMASQYNCRELPKAYFSDKI